MALNVGEIIRELLSEELAEGVNAVGANVSGPDKTGLAGIVQDYGRYACRQWARTPALSSDGKIFGFNTACTDYLSGISEDPISGGGTQCEGVTLNFDERWVTPDCNTEINTGPFSRSFSGTFTPPFSIGPGQPSTACGAGTTYQNIPSGFEVLDSQGVSLGFSDVGAGFTRTPVIASFSCNTEPPGDPIQARPGLPPLGDPPDWPGPTGNLPVDITLEPDGRICVAVDGGAVVCIDPVNDDGKGNTPFNGLLNPDIQPTQTLPPGGGSVDAPPGTKIVYVRVELVTIPVPTPGLLKAPFETNVCNTVGYFPRIGYVCFGFDGGGLEGPYDVSLPNDVLPVFSRTGCDFVSLTLPPGVVADIELATISVDEESEP